MRFTDAHSPAALCAPSRFSILTKNKATEFYNLDNDLAQERNLIDLPERKKRIGQLHAKFLKHNDHNEKTRDPRATKAFRVTR